MYVNVPRLSRLLQKYDPRQPYYIGRWVHEDPSMNVIVNNCQEYTTVFHGSLHSNDSTVYHVVLLISKINDNFCIVDMLVQDYSYHDYKNTIKLL